MPYVNKEQILRAKELDLLSYLQQYEPQELVRAGPHEYRTHTHDSLVISNGKWHWCSKGIGGKTALDYLVHVRGMSFPEAVTELCKGSPASFSFQPVAKPKTSPKTFTPPDRNFSADRVLAYLTGRGIDRDILNCGIREGSVKENIKGPLHEYTKASPA